KEDPQGTHMAKYDLARFRTLFLAGERCDPDTLHWAEDKLRVPVVDHWWQTETAWPIAANCVGLGMLPVRAGPPTKQAPGDDILNAACHRRATGAMEEGLAAHPDVAECAVVGVADERKGEVPVGFVVTKAGVARGEAEIVRELVEKVREQIGPVAAFKTALVVKRLPKTRSGKILRGTMKKIADGHEYGVPATIDDPTILAAITDAHGSKRYPQ